MSYDPTRDNIEVKPGPQPGTVVGPDGRHLEIPLDWTMLPSGDAGLTKRVKSMGPTWSVVDGRERPGLWAPATQIMRAREALEALRSDPRYQKRLAAEKARRELKQVHWQQNFRTAILDYLYFDPCYTHVAKQLADTVKAWVDEDEERTPSRRRSLEAQAETALLAWLAERTTHWEAPDEERTEAQKKRDLLARCNALLDVYRDGDLPDEDCPFAAALGLSGDVRSSAAADEEEAERLKLEEENRRRAEFGLPPTPWPRPVLGRPRGGWSD
jgi:hypothetical protein